MLQSAGKETGPPPSQESSALAFAVATRIQSPSRLSKTFGNYVLTLHSGQPKSPQACKRALPNLFYALFVLFFQQTAPDAHLV